MTDTEDMPLSFESPESTSLERADYDPTTETLIIEFRTGASFAYSPFPVEKWVEFEQAKSRGGYFVRMIRPLFTGRNLFHER